MTVSRYGRRETIAPNIRQDAKGLIAEAKVGKHRTTKRFTRTTPVRTINAWIEAKKTDFRKRRAVFKRRKGTLAGDVALYLEPLVGNTKRDAAALLAHWVLALGTRKRQTITLGDLRGVVEQWKDGGVAASSINHRRRELVKLYDVLDGADVPNLARQIKRVRETLAEPVAYPMDVLTAIIDGMHPRLGNRPKGANAYALARTAPRSRNRSQACLRLLLWTGMPWASLARLSPRRVAADLVRGELWYPPRHKGKGAPGVLLPAFPQTITSAQAWLRAFAPKVTEGVLLRRLQAAATRYAEQAAAKNQLSPVPPTVTVYQLRHSFLTWLYETTGDPYLVQLYGQHQDLETTQRYTRKGVPTRAAVAIQQVRAGVSPVLPAGTQRENAG